MIVKCSRCGELQYVPVVIGRVDKKKYVCIKCQQKEGRNEVLQARE